MMQLRGNNDSETGRLRNTVTSDESSAMKVFMFLVFIGSGGTSALWL